MKKNRSEYKKMFLQLYSETTARFREIRILLKKRKKKLTWKQVFGLIPIEYCEIKKEADEKNVFIAVVINRELNEVLDIIENEVLDIIEKE